MNMTNKTISVYGPNIQRHYLCLQPRHENNYNCLSAPDDFFLVKGVLSISFRVISSLL